MKHKVTIVDDHTLLSQAIGNLVDGFDDFETNGIFGNGLDVLNALKSGKINPEIILMDVKMPVMNGVETTRLITKEFPKIYVLALSVEEEERTIIEMIKAGAKGYLSKDIRKELLYMALTETLREGFFHTQNVTEALIENLKNKESVEELKERELEFIQLACSDMTYKEIAKEMNCSPKTVDNYREAVFSKLNAKNRIGLVLFAIKHGIYELE